jgi:2-amino-4-hydroxy-6-hydroxymethyldihydropteridine diphosphokinase
MAIIYVGIGSNVGDRTENFKEALSRLGSADSLAVSEKSDFYLTSPEGGPPQEDYLNGVIKAETWLSPEECLMLFKRVEEEMGRVPAGRNHPRIIDLDLLFYDDVVMNAETPTLPHPRLHERSFVLRGLVQVAPELVHPVLGKTMRELYEVLGST